MVLLATPPTRAQALAYALDRAAASGISCRPVSDLADTWLVTSASHPGLRYCVTPAGCSCPAGLAGRVCKHLALVDVAQGSHPSRQPSRATAPGTVSAAIAAAPPAPRYQGPELTEAQAAERRAAARRRQAIDDYAHSQHRRPSAR